MSNFDSVDFFTDESLLEDPVPVLRAPTVEGSVLPTTHCGVVAVSGYDEATEIYRDIETFSSCNSVIGPFATFPVPLEGDDVSEIIEGYRDQLPMNEHMVTMDPPAHTRERALLMRLITPKRLKENEALCGASPIDSSTSSSAPAAASSSAPTPSPSPCWSSPTCSACRRRTTGVSGRVSALSATPGGIGPDQSECRSNALGWLDDWFATYIEDRRREPRHDVLTDLALAKYPDGSTPDVTAVVRTATFLFAAGQETTARLLATGLKYLAEYPDLQDELRAHRERIPDFIEEALRIESPVKADSA